MSVAARVAEEMGFKLGNEVGMVTFTLSCFIAHGRVFPPSVAAVLCSQYSFRQTPVSYTRLGLVWYNAVWHL